MFQSNSEIACPKQLVFVTAVHFNAVTWIESVNMTSFEVCALKAGRADRKTPDGGLTFVDYVAFQEAPVNAVAGQTIMLDWWVGTNCKDVSFQSVSLYNYLGYICVIDQACSVKMAGYWPSSFLRFYGLNEVEVHKNAKKERGQYPAILTEQAWSIEDLLYGFIVKLRLQKAHAKQNMKLFSLQPTGVRFIFSASILVLD